MARIKLNSTNHLLNVSVMNRLLHKETSRCDAVLTLVEEHCIHTLGTANTTSEHSAVVMICSY